MAYASAMGGYGAGASLINPDTSHVGIIDVPDAELLFRGEFHRAGPDLVLIGQDGHRFVIPSYFSSEHPAALAAPNGARLSADVVAMLAGSVAPDHYAQAQGQTVLPDVIGRVEKVIGDCTVVRNGVAVAVHVGDPVYKSDVIQTGASAQLGVAFPDGTALNLVANTRMGLNEYSYDANSTSNSALFSVIQGTFGFVAGKVAHTGDMKISTPVATMGIRGTTGMGHQMSPQEIADIKLTLSSDLGDVSWSFVVADDFGVNRHGIYDVYGLNGDLLGSVGDTNLLYAVDALGHFVSELLKDSDRQFNDALFHGFSDWLSLAGVIPRSINGSHGSSDTPLDLDLDRLFYQQPINFNGQPFDLILPVYTPGGGRRLSSPARRTARRTTRLAIRRRLIRRRRRPLCPHQAGSSGTRMGLPAGVNRWRIGVPARHPR
jgi:hypothetical protein